MSPVPTSGDVDSVVQGRSLNPDDARIDPSNLKDLLKNMIAAGAAATMTKVYTASDFLKMGNIGPIATVDVTNGSDFALGDTGTLLGVQFGSDDAEYEVTGISEFNPGEISELTITKGGTKYTVNENISLIPGGSQPGIGTGADGHVTAVDTSDLVPHIAAPGPSKFVDVSKVFAWRSAGEVGLSSGSELFAWWGPIPRDDELNMCSSESGAFSKNRIDEELVTGNSTDLKPSVIWCDRLIDRDTAPEKSVIENKAIYLNAESYFDAVEGADCEVTVAMDYVIRQV